MVSMRRGFIVLWRKFTETSFYKDSYMVHLAIHLILMANHEPRKFTMSGQEQTLERGQHLTGRKRLSDDLNIPEATIARKIKILEKIGFLTLKTNNKFTIITICNYGRYQNIKNNNDTTSDTTSGQPVIQRADTNNNTTTITTNNHIQEGNNHPHIFIKPSLDELKIFCKERNLPVDVDKFFDYYTSNGWRVGRGPMRNWQAACRNWSRNEFSQNRGHENDDVPLEFRTKR